MADKVDERALEALLSGCKTPQDVAALYTQMLQRVIDRGLSAELDAHLGYERHAKAVEGERSNTRNGSTKKRLKGTFGALEVTTPRDRAGTFEPQLVKKRQTRLGDFEDKILALYARGMSTRDIQAHVRELYGIEVSPDLVSAVTDSVIDEVAAWQARPLEATYAIVFFDALRVKIRDEGLVRNKAVYLAIGVRSSGEREVLGLWIEQTEGAKFWLRVMNEIKARGTNDILIAVVDGLKGFPEAITTVFPQAIVQTCIVHLIRYTMQFASWKERKAIAGALKPIYRADHADAAWQALEAFDEGPWGQKYPAIAQSWRRNWEAVIPFFAFPTDVRKIIYTTNAIESLNASVRKAIRNKGHFPSDQAATKLIWLSLRHITENWKRPPIAWQAAKAQFALQFGDRFAFND